MNRCFKAFSVISGGTLQPLIGCKLGAAIVPNGANQNIALANLGADGSTASLFQAGDDVWLETGTSAEKCNVLAVPDSTHITVLPVKAHASGGTVALALPCCSIYLQLTDGGTGPLYIFSIPSQFGKAPIAAAITNGVQLYAKVQKVASGTQAIDFSTGQKWGANDDNSAFYWVDGSTGDTYVATIQTV